MPSRNLPSSQGPRNSRTPRRLGRTRPPGRDCRPAAEVLEGRQLLAVAIGEIALPSNGPPGTSHPGFIVAGPDGNLWVTESPRTIDRVTTGGTVNEFSIPGTGDLGKLAAGADGNVWFLDNPAAGDATAGVKVGRITPDGAVAEFPITGTTRNSSGYAIASGPDGNLWAILDNQIDRITPAGTVTAFPFGGANGPADIVSGHDGNLWFTSGGTSVGKISTAGVVTVLPTPLTGHFVSSDAMAVGADGNIDIAVINGFTGPDADSLDTVTPDGTVTADGLGGHTFSIALGPDGNLWMTQNLAQGPGQFGPVRIVGPAGQLTPPTEGTTAGIITAGPDGDLWFTEPDSNRLGRVVLNAPTPATLTASAAPPLATTAGATVQGRLASFAPLQPGDTAADYVARIAWGDGTTSSGTIAPDGQGRMSVHGTHVYLAQGTRGIDVTIRDVELAAPGAGASVSTSIAIGQPPLVPQPVDVTAYRGDPGPLLVARASTVDLTHSYTATIDWGDGSTSVGQVTSVDSPGSGGAGTTRQLTVVGDHTYANDAAYTVHVTIKDEGGVATDVVSTILFATPTIWAARASSIASKLGESTAPADPGDFYLTFAGVPADRFTATIDWGDGSAPTPGTIVMDMEPGVYTVQGTHVYHSLGTFPLRVTVSGFGQQVSATGLNDVSAPPLALSGGLDPASDTGYSNRDGITNATQPHFLGTATPGTTVELFARNGDGSAPLAIGHAVAGGDGRWSIVSTRLPEGTYVITAIETVADGRRFAAAVVATKGAGGRLVVDTTGPRVSGVALDPATGQLVLDFRDDRSQVDPLGLVAAGAVHFSRITAAGATAIPARVSSIQPGGGSVTLGLGHSLASGRYALQIQAGSVRDAAGNALDGEFRGLFPTGDGRPGGGFVAGFVTRGIQSTPAQPLVAEPPLQAAGIPSRRDGGRKG